MDIEENKLPIIDKAGLSEIWRLAKAKFLAQTELDPLTTAIAMVNQKADANTQALTPINQAITELGYQKLSISGGTMIGTLTTRTLTPSANNTYDIGTSSVKYRNVYANAISSTTGSFSQEVKVGFLKVANNNAIKFYDYASTSAQNPEQEQYLMRVLAVSGQNDGVYVGCYHDSHAATPISIYGSNISFMGGSTRTRYAYINENGNIGIGTTSPTQKLHVEGSTYTNGNILTSGAVGLNNGSTITIKDTDGTHKNVLTVNSSNHVALGYGYRTTSTSDTQIWFGNRTAFMCDSNTVAAQVDRAGITSYGGVAAYGIADLSLI